jgi:hypothetical protein
MAEILGILPSGYPSIPVVIPGDLALKAGPSEAGEDPDPVNLERVLAVIPGSGIRGYQEAMPTFGELSHKRLHIRFGSSNF